MKLDEILKLINKLLKVYKPDEICKKVWEIKLNKIFKKIVRDYNYVEMGPIVVKKYLETLPLNIIKNYCEILNISNCSRDKFEIIEDIMTERRELYLNLSFTDFIITLNNKRLFSDENLKKFIKVSKFTSKELFF